MPDVAPIDTVSGVAGDRVACGPDGAWAAASGRLVALSDGRRLQAPRLLAGALRFSADGRALLAGVERLELASGEWAELGDARPAIAAGIGELEITCASWDAGGRQLAVGAALRPSRSPGAGPAGQRGWLTLLDGATRTALRPLWSGGGPPPRTVALERGVIAADPGRHARVWTEEGEIAPDTGPVDGLALGDGGRLLVVTHRDGRAVAWHGPDFGAPEDAGEGATGPVAAAAGAPVAAWATDAGATVRADGATARLAVPSPRALALDAAGERLAVLDGDGALRLAAIRR